MWHQVEHNYNTKSDKKYISKLFYYTQIMINILVISFHNINFKEKKWCSGYNIPPVPLNPKVQCSIPLSNSFFSPKTKWMKRKTSFGQVFHN